MKPLFLLGAALFAASVQAAEFKVPRAEKSQLANGLTVYLLPQTEVPLVHVRLVADAGAKRDGAQAGLANLTGDSLILGTRNRDKANIEQAFESRGASIGAGADLDAATLNSTFMKSDAETLLPIMAEIAREASFPDAEFDKLRDRTLSQLKQQRQSPRNVIDNYFSKLVLGNNLDAHTVSGLQSTVSALKASDARAFHKRHWRPDSSAVIVVGDFEPKAMKQALDKAFSQWKSEAEKPAALPRETVAAATEARVWLLDKPDAIETTFLIGGMGIPVSHPERFKLDVINTILGGRFTSWLNDELRVNSGLTYGARSAFNLRRDNGSFAISSFTKTETTEKALDLALKTYARLWEQGIDAATLASAKAYLKGQFPPRYETAAQLAGAIASQHVYGLSPDWLDKFGAAVDQLTLEEANALAKKYFPREHLQWVLIGKAEAIRDLAKKYGKVTEGKLADDRFDLP